MKLLAKISTVLRQNTNIAASSQATYEDTTQQEDTTEPPTSMLRGPQSYNIEVVKETPVNEEAESMPNFQVNLDTDIAASSTVDVTEQDAAIAMPSVDLQRPGSVQKIEFTKGPGSVQMIDSTAGCGDRCHHLRRR